MGRLHDELTDDLIDWIERQHLFFVASATANGRVNVSPKGLDAFRVLGPNAVAYLDRTGSGSETNAHLIADGRLTIMFCAFEGAPLILRLYGRGTAHYYGSESFDRLIADLFGGEQPAGARQVITLDVELVQTSCGFGVPLFDYQGERLSLPRWAEAQGQEKIEAYWREKNNVSIDGLPTGLVTEDA